jgi:hypothetical protein
MTPRGWVTLGALLLALGAAPKAVVSAQTAALDATTLLFEEPQLAGTKPGDVLAYSYSRKASDTALFGPSFDDTIRLTVEKGSRDDTRTVRVELFTGANRRAAGPFEDMAGNPILSLFLEQHIEVLASQFQANPRYFKTSIRAALRERATVTSDEIKLGRRSFPGWHVTIAPFKDDPNKALMHGLDAMTYDFAVTKAIPGEIAEIHVTAPGAPNGNLLDERIVYAAKVD